MQIVKAALVACWPWGGGSALDVININMTSPYYSEKSEKLPFC